MKERTRYLIAVVVMLLISTLFIAQRTRGGATIACINVERIFTVLGQKREIKTELDRVLAGAKRDIEQLTATIQKLEQKLEDVTISENRRNRIKIDIAYKEKELKEKVREYENEILLREEELSGAVLKDIYDGIKRIASQKDIDIVLELRGASVMYVEGKLDITADVLKYLQELEQYKRQQ